MHGQVGRGVIGQHAQDLFLAWGHGRAAFPYDQLDLSARDVLHGEVKMSERGRVNLVFGWGGRVKIQAVISEALPADAVDIEKLGRWDS